MKMPQSPQEQIAPRVNLSFTLGDFYRYVDHTQLAHEAVLDPESGRFKVPENGFPLITGKRGMLLDLPGEPGPRQGNVVVTIVGDEKDYRNSPTSGEELWRPHSACSFSSAGVRLTKYFIEIQKEAEKKITPERWRGWLAAVTELKNPMFNPLSYADYTGAHLIELVHELKMEQYEPSPDCDCRAQGEAALKTVVENGGGVFELVEQEGRGHGLEAKFLIYALQEFGYESDEACEILGLEYEKRDFSHCAQALLDWTVAYDRDLTDITLMTNNEYKHNAFRAHGIKTRRRKHIHGVTEYNTGYLRMKSRHGHRISEKDLILDGKQETS